MKHLLLLLVFCASFVCIAEDTQTTMWQEKVNQDNALLFVEGFDGCQVATLIHVTEDGNYIVDINNQMVVVDEVNNCNYSEEERNNIIKTTGHGPGSGHGGLETRGLQRL